MISITRGWLQKWHVIASITNSLLFKEIFTRCNFVGLTPPDRLTIFVQWFLIFLTNIFSSAKTSSFSKSVILFNKTNPLFVRKSLIIFQIYFFVLTPLSVTLLKCFWYIFFLRISAITFYSLENVCGESLHHWVYTRECWTHPASYFSCFIPNIKTTRWNLGLVHAFPFPWVKTGMKSWIFFKVEEKSMNVST